MPGIAMPLVGPSSARASICFGFLPASSLMVPATILASPQLIGCSAPADCSFPERSRRRPCSRELRTRLAAALFFNGWSLPLHFRPVRPGAGERDAAQQIQVARVQLLAVARLHGERQHQLLAL